jgi:hypothetical protein
MIRPGSRVRRVSLCVLTSIALVGTPAASQSTTQASDRGAALLDSLLRANRHPIALDGGTLSGPGARLLLDAARDAQFFMIGESHNGADTPRFTAALFDALRAHDFRYYAVEYGPVLGRMLSRPGVRGNEEATFALARRYPHAFQFWDDEELVAMASIGKRSPATSDAIWGLDNEWGALHALDRLDSIAPTPGAREHVRSLIAEVRPVEAQRPTGGGSFARFISAADSGVFDNLRLAFAPREASEAAFLIDALETSNRLYLYNRAAGEGALTGWRSNADREQYMKRNLMVSYRAAQRAGDTLPRVLLKFGSVHAGNWLSATNVHTIGSFVDEFAIANGRDAFHLVAWLVNEPGTYWTLTESPAYLPLAEVGSTRSWTIVDLRPLRPFTHAGRLSSMSREMRALVFAYDAVLLIGSGTRGTHERLQRAP